MALCRCAAEPRLQGSLGEGAAEALGRGVGSACEVEAHHPAIGIGIGVASGYQDRGVGGIDDDVDGAGDLRGGHLGFYVVIPDGNGGRFPVAENDIRVEAGKDAQGVDPHRIAALERAEGWVDGGDQQLGGDQLG